VPGVATRRVLVTGGAGNVAGWIVRTAPADVELHLTRHRTPVPADVAAAASLHGVDLTDATAVGALVERLRPEVVLHTAYRQDDRAAIVLATEAVARASAAVGASMVQLSTDVVFAGDRPPYAEDDPTDPITDYGRWKVEAERRARSALPDVCTTRTSLVVSVDPMDRATAALAGALAAGSDVTLFHDELRQPIRAADLAAELWALVALDRKDRAGVWHLPGPEHLSRLELGLRLARRLGLDVERVRATSAADHDAPRPRDPELVGARRAALGVPLRPVDG
jgi:dTDP-4-dehydrorhamnose reductase